MQKHAVLTLTGTGTNAVITRGTLGIEKGKQMVGVRLKVTLSIANATGGAVVLSDAQKQALFALFSVKFSYGRQGGFVPFPAGTLLTRIHREARRAYGTELKNYTDSTTGLSKSLPDAATTAVVFWITIPTGMAHYLKEKNLWGMGRSQVRTAELELRMGSTATIASGLTVSGNVVAEVIPDARSVKGDRWCVLPEWFEGNTTDKRVKLPPGLPLAVVERTAVHASTSLTNITVKVDEEVIHDQVGPLDAIAEYNDSPTLASAGQLSDRETLILAVTDNTRLGDLPTGPVEIVQNGTQQLATFNYGYLFVPIVEREKLDAEFEHIGHNLRTKTIRVANVAAVEQLDVPDRLKFATPLIVLDQDDKEFERFPGPVVEMGQKARLLVPTSLRDMAAARIAAHRAHGEDLAAEGIIRELASAVPGAVQSPRGFNGQFSSALSQINGWFAK